MGPLPAYVLVLTIGSTGAGAGLTTAPGAFYERAACESALARWRIEAKNRMGDGYCLRTDEFYGPTKQLYGEKP